MNAAELQEQLRAICAGLPELLVSLVAARNEMLYGHVIFTQAAFEAKMPLKALSTECWQK